MERTLNILTACDLATILRGAQEGKRITWAKGGDTSDVVEGTMRAISHEGGGFLRSDEDVRDGYIHITTMILEIWMPMTEALDLMHKELMFIG